MMTHFGYAHEIHFSEVNLKHHVFSSVSYLPSFNQFSLSNSDESSARNSIIMMEP
jgi:hypothetical protein